MKKKVYVIQSQNDFNHNSQKKYIKLEIEIEVRRRGDNQHHQHYRAKFHLKNFAEKFFFQKKVSGAHTFVIKL